MIAKGTTHNRGAKLARYMVTGKKGERAELYELWGFAEDDIVDAFRSVHVMAEATQCEKPFFHAQVRNPEGDELTREQWEHAADRIEAKLGLTGQPRAIAFHLDEKSGHEHMHVAWSRIDDENLTAKPLPFFKLRLKEACRELEVEFDITRVSSERPGAEMAPTRGEDEQARRLGVDIRDVRATIREAWEQADSGRAFAAALEQEGLTLCQGERRDYVVLDHEGGMHALGKRVLGTSAAETRARMGDIDREALPTVEQARSQLTHEHTLEVADDSRRGREPEASAPAYVETPAPKLEELARARDCDEPVIGERGPDITDAANTAACGAERIAGLVLDIGEKATEKVTEGLASSLESLFDAAPKPVPRPAAEPPKRESEPEPGPPDHWRYIMDEAYRKQIMAREADERERQIKNREELERTGQTRDRER